MKKILLFACLAIATAMTPVSAGVKVLAFAGSSRTDSYNKQLLSDAVDIAKQMGATVTVIDLKDYPMPFYDADSEAKEGMPKEVKRFRDLMISNQAIIIASPEYNSSIPAVLKNALDWASRGEDGNSSREAYKGKNFAIMSASPGKGGGRRGLDDLRSVIEDCGGTVMPTQVTIPNAHKYFSDNERPPNNQLKLEIQELLQPKTVSKKAA